MTIHHLKSVAMTLVTGRKGILAADETTPTLTRRFDTLGIELSEQTRRIYREMRFTCPGQFISGVIMYDETIRQKSCDRMPLAETFTRRGIIPGIKIDTGAKPLAGSPHETVTEGLDGVRDHLREYHGMGALFAKWRAVIHVTDVLPSTACVSANAHALARYASLCQEQELVPIVEPEVLMDGSHTIARCEEVTGVVLHAVFHALVKQGVALEGILLKPNLIIAGKACTRQASAEEVAAPTLRCLRRHAPAAVPGIVFLSGGQHALRPLISMQSIDSRVPTPGRPVSPVGALQDPALEGWHGLDENPAAGLPPSSPKRSRKRRHVHARNGGGITKHRRNWRDD
jgi:fructose-bisphosphate aldolase, class I